MEYGKNDIDLKWKKKLLFSGVFVQENRLHAIMDRYLKEITSKQWLVMVVADAYDNPPDLSTLAKMLEKVQCHKRTGHAAVQERIGGNQSGDQACL